MSDPLTEASRQTDTFRFVIERGPGTDRRRTISAEAIGATGDQIKAWIAARMLSHWEETGVPPRFLVIDVKVGVE